MAAAGGRRVIAKASPFKVPLGGTPRAWPRAMPVVDYSRRVYYIQYSVSTFFISALFVDRALCGLRETLCVVELVLEAVLYGFLYTLVRQVCTTSGSTVYDAPIETQCKQEPTSGIRRQDPTRGATMSPRYTLTHGHVWHTRRSAHTQTHVPDSRH